jgi:hypothetical protein
MGSGLDALLYEYLKDYMRAREASPWESYASMKRLNVVVITAGGGF